MFRKDSGLFVFWRATLCRCRVSIRSVRECNGRNPCSAVAICRRIGTSGGTALRVIKMLFNNQLSQSVHAIRKSRVTNNFRGVAQPV
jgi:hypothetical protein